MKILHLLFLMIALNFQLNAQSKKSQIIGIQVSIDSVKNLIQLSNLNFLNKKSEIDNQISIYNVSISKNETNSGEIKTQKNELRKLIKLDLDSILQIENQLKDFEDSINYWNEIFHEKIIHMNMKNNVINSISTNFHGNPSYINSNKNFKPLTGLIKEYIHFNRYDYLIGKYVEYNYEGDYCSLCGFYTYLDYDGFVKKEISIYNGLRNGRTQSFDTLNNKIYLSNQENYYLGKKLGEQYYFNSNHDTIGYVNLISGNGKLVVKDRENVKKNNDLNLIHLELLNNDLGFFKKFESNFEENYKDGLLNGKRICYYSNGKVKSIENFQDGLPNGQQEYFDLYGNIIGHVNLINGTGDLFVNFTNNVLNIQIEKHYSSGKLTGDLKLISNGIIGKYSLISQLKEGVYNGKFIEEDESTAKKIIINYSNGYIHGTLNLFNNDHPIFEQNFNMGELHGPQYSWYASGKEKTIEKYSKGSPEEILILSENGGIIRNSKFNLSDGASIVTEYYQDGNIRSINKLNAKGQLHGERKIYFGSGEIAVHSFYKNGNLEGKIEEFYSNGKPSLKGFLKNGKGQFVYYAVTHDIPIYIDKYENWKVIEKLEYDSEGKNYRQRYYR